MDKKRKIEGPTGPEWRGPTPEEEARDVCSAHSTSMVTRLRLHREDGPAVEGWHSVHGYYEVLVRFCPACDPHVPEARP